MLASPRIHNVGICILQWAAVQAEVVGTQVGIGYDISQEGAFISRWTFLSWDFQET